MKSQGRGGEKRHRIARTRGVLAGVRQDHGAARMTVGECADVVDLAGDDKERLTGLAPGRLGGVDASDVGPREAARCARVSFRGAMHAARPGFTVTHC